LVESADRSDDLRPATVLAVVAFLVFGLLVAGLVTNTFALDDQVEAWVGAGLVGLSTLTFATWATVLYRDVDMDWASRAGGDLVLLGLAIAELVAGLAVFAAGVL
jgi:hypothetical protein